MVSEHTQGTAQRVAFVADELLGYAGNGIGTTTTFVSLALARMGHRVEVHYAGPALTGSVDAEWRQLYDEAGVRVLEVAHSPENVEPGHFARSRDVESALRADPPDVVVVQDLGAPAYTALRLRRLGLAFEQTLFVVFCHGTRQWITDVSRKVRVLPGAHAVTVLERASVQLADAVVSPSAYLVDWMRSEGWQLPPQTFVIPHVSRAGATGEASPAQARSERVERVAFFGRLEERKGVRPFVAAVSALDPKLLEQVDLEFIGRPTQPWPVERVTALLSDSARGALRGISFETALDQHEALARLRRSGTLAVMPSFEENSPNTVYECLENGIPFVAGNVAGIRELVAPEDHARVLFEPTEAGIAEALRRALEGADALRPARPAFDDAESLRRWQEVLALPAPAFPPRGDRTPVDVVVVRRSARSRSDSPSAALAAQTDADVRVTVVPAEGRAPEDARAAALSALETDWVVFLDEDDEPEPTLVETLWRAQEVSGADVVSCGLFLRDATGRKSVHLFPGEPGALGLLANGYGTVALLRRSLLDPAVPDPDWPLLAGLSVSGARIVSVPIPLVTRTERPGTLLTHPADARRVLDHLEGALPRHLRLLAELAPRLAADAQRPAPTRSRSFARRAARRLLTGLRR